MECLELPIPDFISSTIQNPPGLLWKKEDIAVLRMVRQFGHEFECTQQEIQQACDLAFGPSDIAIILERPIKPWSSLPFEDSIRSSTTLNGVNELIKFASKGTRSIHDVTILDAYSFQYKGDEKIPSHRCLSLLQNILILKQPKVLLVCTAGLRSSPHLSLDALRSGGVGLWPIRALETIGTTVCSVFRSFHPSAVLNWTKLATFYRLLLVCHFVLAFGELSNRWQPCPDWVHYINQRAINEQKNYSRGWNSEIALIRISSCLMALIGIPRPKCRIVHRNEEKQRQRGAEEVTQLLRRVATSKIIALGCDIFELCFLWKQCTKLVNIEHGKDAMARLCSRMHHLQDFESHYEVDFLENDTMIKPISPMPTTEAHNELITALGQLQLQSDTSTMERASDTSKDTSQTTLEKLPDKISRLNKKLADVINKCTDLRLFILNDTAAPARMNIHPKNGDIFSAAEGLIDIFRRINALIYRIAAFLTGNKVQRREQNPEPYRLENAFLQVLESVEGLVSWVSNSPMFDLAFSTQA